MLIQWQPLYQYRVQHGGQADHPLSWLTTLLWLLALFVLAGRRARRESARELPPLIFGLGLTAISAFMISRQSLPLWQPLAPILANLQYPWRFLMLTALGLAMSAGALPANTPDFPAPFPRREGGLQRPSPRRRGVGGEAVTLILLALILQSLLTIPSQPLPFPAAEAWSPDRMWREDAAAGQVGATWTAEFLPLTVSEQRWALGRPREGATAGPAISPHPAVRLTKLGYDQVELEVAAATPFSLRLHQFHLPAWRATLDGRPIATYPSGELGLVTVDLPAGRAGGSQRVSLRFGPTPAAWIGSALALAAAAIVTGLAWRQRRLDRRLLGVTAGLLIVVTGLAANQTGLGQRTWTPWPVNAAVSDVALLLGYDVAPARTADALDVTLYWFALRDVGANYKSFVHLLGSEGTVIGQHDGDPGGGFTPTSRWRAGELVADRHRIPVPAGRNPAETRLKAGMYQPEPMRNLPLTPPAADGRIDLGLRQ